LPQSTRTDNLATFPEFKGLSEVPGHGISVGLDKILNKMKAFQATMGDTFKPAPLLEKLVAEGKKFQDLR
jgi:3-hydroxyacyl-CoA dehydrogenase